MAHAIFFDNPFQQNFVRFGASPYKCIVTDSILDGAGLTTAEHFVETQAIGGSIDFSIVVNTTSTGGSALNQRNADDYSNEYRQRFLYTAARHNTVINHGVSAVFGNGPFVGYCRLHKNVLRNTNAARNAADVTLTDGNNTNWIDSDDNVWDIANPTGWWINNQGVITSNSFATWQALGRDPNSIVTSVTVINPTYGLANHSQAEGGPATKADFLTALRTRGRTTWSDLYDAQAAYNNFAAAYAPTNLPALDLSPDGYYGHYDYREGLPVFFTISGPSALEIDEEGTYTLTPSDAPDDTVDLLDDGTPAGAFMPSLITWTGTAQDSRTFIYTPAEAGARVVTAEIDSTIVATKTVTVTDPEEPPIPPVGLVASTEWRW
jgi:hypothetical protein